MRAWLALRGLTFDRGTQDDFFLPDLCAPRMVLVVVLVSQLLAIAFALARPSAAPFLTELARISLFVQWVGLTGAAALCYSRRWLSRLSVPLAAFMAFVLLLGPTALFSEAAFLIGRNLSERGFSAPLFPTDHWAFLLRNGGICAIVSAMLLRYLFVAHQWRLHVREEARSRIHALQARIRPHFLFNSLNTIASLIPEDPGSAERAIEDLADLFRGSMRRADDLISLKQELELAEKYLHMERRRIGERLRVDWQVSELPPDARILPLTLQPLLENAVVHGIQPLVDGGEVRVYGRSEKDKVVITICNPYGPGGEVSAGHGMALINIRERLKLAFGTTASLVTHQDAEQFFAVLSLPYVKSPDS